MPNPNAIVSTNVRLSEDRQTVELDDGRTVRLPPDETGAPGFVQVLDGLARLRHPVYLEIDPATDAIEQLRIPLVTRVAAVVQSEGGLDIELAGSHGRHRLRPGGADSDDLERALRD